MSLLGVRLTVLLGRTVPVPAPELVLRSLRKVEVSHKDDARSVFKLELSAGRASVAAADYPLLALPQLQPGSRCVLVVTFGARPAVLMDGILTHGELRPGRDGASASLSLIGEDLGVAMDREERPVSQGLRSDSAAVRGILANYTRYGLRGEVIEPPTIDAPGATEPRMQRATDYAYVRALAQKHDYAFFILPGPTVGVSRAYFGPKRRPGPPQPALSVDMGPESNVDDIDFQNDATSVIRLEGYLQDKTTNERVAVHSRPIEPTKLAAEPTLQNDQLVRTRQYRSQGPQSAKQAHDAASARSKATANVLQGSGELDAARYGRLLEPHRMVSLRGAGLRHDGLYWVTGVTHHIEQDKYTQSFTIEREGTGSTVSTVTP